MGSIGLNFASQGTQRKQFLSDGTFAKWDRWGGEAVTEVLAYEVSRACKLPGFLPYKLAEGLQGVCLSPNFKLEGLSFVPFASLVTEEWVVKNLQNKSPKDRFKAILDVYVSLGIDSYQSSEYLRTMFSMDCLLLNTDRHLNNFGVYTNSNGTTQLGYIFDNGYALGVIESWQQNFSKKKFLSGSRDSVKMQPLGKDLSKVVSFIGYPPNFSVSDFVLNHDPRITVNSRQFCFCLSRLERVYNSSEGMLLRDVFLGTYGNYR